jgi:CO/xanthine dehydrogenase FAD-binding subunit
MVKGESRRDSSKGSAAAVCSLLLNKNAARLTRQIRLAWRAVKAEEALRGKRIDESAAQKASEIALEAAKPLKDNAYKVGMAKSLIQRAPLTSV